MVSHSVFFFFFSLFPPRNVARENTLVSAALSLKERLMGLNVGLKHNGKICFFFSLSIQSIQNSVFQINFIINEC